MNAPKLIKIITFWVSHIKIRGSIWSIAVRVNTWSSDIVFHLYKGFLVCSLHKSCCRLMVKKLLLGKPAKNLLWSVWILQDEWPGVCIFNYHHWGLLISGKKSAGILRCLPHLRGCGIYDSHLSEGVSKLWPSFRPLKRVWNYMYPLSKGLWILRPSPLFSSPNGDNYAPKLG